MKIHKVVQKKSVPAARTAPREMSVARRTAEEAAKRPAPSRAAKTPSFGFPPPAKRPHASTVSVVTPKRAKRRAKPTGTTAKKPTARRGSGNRGS